jgi:maleate isomerase
MNDSRPLEQTGIGVIVPYDFALDRELWRWVPDDISLHLTRMPYVPLAATMDMAIHISDSALVARGVTDVSAVSPLVTAYACTSGSFVGGLAGEAAIVAAMKEAGAPAAVTTSGALLTALRRLDINRVATATPYTADLTAGLSRYLAEAGVEVVAAAGLGLTSQIWTVPYDVTAQLVRDTDRADADAVDTTELFDRALAEGVAFIPGPAFSPTGRFASALRLCFASTPPDRIFAGVARLRRAVDLVAKG